MGKRNLHDRLMRLESRKRRDTALGATVVDEAMRARYWERHSMLCSRRKALLDARKALPLRQQLAYLRHDCRVAESRRDAQDSFQKILRWWRHLEVRKLETAILAHEGLATAQQLNELRAADPAFLEPLAPLPVPLEVKPMEDEALAQVDREIDAWKAEYKAVIDFERSLQPDPESYRRLRESLKETGELCIKRAEPFLRNGIPASSGSSQEAQQE